MFCYTLLVMFGHFFTVFNWIKLSLFQYPHKNPVSQRYRNISIITWWLTVFTVHWVSSEGFTLLFHVSRLVKTPSNLPPSVLRPPKQHASRSRFTFFMVTPQEKKRKSLCPCVQTSWTSSYFLCSLFQCSLLEVSSVSFALVSLSCCCQSGQLANWCLLQLPPEQRVGLCVWVCVCVTPLSVHVDPAWLCSMTLYSTADS